MEKITKILSFFRDVESMEIPSAPRLQRLPSPVVEFLSSRPRQMPWENRSPGLTQRDATFHLVCLGVSEMRPLIERVLEAIAPDAEIDEELMARQRGQGFLGTILLDWQGRPVKDNLLPAPFVYGVDRLVEGKSLSGLDKEIAEKVTQIAEAYFGDTTLAVDESAPPPEGNRQKPSFDFEVHENRMTHALLDRLSRGLAGKLGISVDTVNFRVMTRTVRRRKRRDLSPPDFSEVVTPSFYVADLASVERTIKKKGLSVPLEAYLGEATDPEQRIDLLVDANAMMKAVSPDRLGLGRWPSNPRQPLCLAQQAAVGMAIEEGDHLTAINGPPGTGKTTLLRDVIAHSVIERAQRLHDLEDPMDAFVETHTSDSSFPVIRPELVEGTGILVASNNNAAVENISTELPRAAEIDLTSFGEADYLKEVANDVAKSFGEKEPDCWGLMALKLGNKSNTEASLRGLDQPYREGGDKSVPPNGLFERLRGTAHFGDWMSAKAAFRMKMKALEDALKPRVDQAVDLGHCAPDEDSEENLDEDASLNEETKEDPIVRDQCFQVPDDAFFAQTKESQHLASVWVDPDLDRLRSEVFLAALRLHDVVLRLNAAELRRMIYPMKRALTGQEKLTSLQMVKVWNTLFFISPVISTTLASVRKMPMVRGWIGHVLIDEAGQATPQSVVGILQRACKATVVGDPLQIEPVFTVPAPVVDKLRESYEIDKRFSPSSASAQTIADATMSIGAWVRVGGEDGNRVWTGAPLRVHRRCAEPMFSIANRIAYDGQMVQAANMDPVFDNDPGPSTWIDVTGSSGQNKVVPEEMMALRREMEQLKRAWPQRGGAPASVFVISPFVSVASEADQVVRSVLGRDAWKMCPTGTVHRFQGREADIVYLVLGSNPGPRGDGSRKWAALRPNLLNVALTRAKARIFVVGEFDSWSRQPYFSKLAQTMQMREAVFKVQAP
jgi:hypothetical protein